MKSGLIRKGEAPAGKGAPQLLYGFWADAMQPAQFGLAELGDLLQTQAVGPDKRAPGRLRQFRREVAVRW